MIRLGLNAPGYCIDELGDRDRSVVVDIGNRRRKSCDQRGREHAARGIRISCDRRRWRSRRQRLPRTERGLRRALGARKLGGRELEVTARLTHLIAELPALRRGEHDDIRAPSTGEVGSELVVRAPLE